MNQRELFLKHVAQTSGQPLGLEIIRAEGMKLFDASGKTYLDLIGGISVCNTGHRHPAVVEAIRKQADQYLHLMVYGEFIQTPQVQYASRLCAQLPDSLNAVYFTNSGAEAVEGAMKLAKRITGRTDIIGFDQSYHGSTQGALSLIGDEYWRNAFRPLLPGIYHLPHNSMEALGQITVDTACVVAECIQAERGVYTPTVEWMKALRKRCSDTGTLLVLDEIQTGFGRTGTWWAFEQFGIVPDILLLGKALGGGMPLGAFVADRELMWKLTDRPVLGHITTFGGHPVSCAAGLAAMNVLEDERLIAEVKTKESLFRSRLIHPRIKAFRSSGLLMSIEFDDFETNKRLIDACLQKGLLTDWFLFAPNCMRLAPPLVISEDEIKFACEIIVDVLSTVNK